MGGPKAGDLIGALVARSYPVAQDVTLARRQRLRRGEPWQYLRPRWQRLLRVYDYCFEDDAKQIAYSSGWHQVADSDASGGHFRVNPNKNGNGSLKLTFDVNAGRTGAVVYNFAKSTKGGTADVYIDGAFKSQIAFNGSTGSLNDPVFGFNARFGGLPAGPHTFELRNVRGAVYVDGFCLESARLQAARHDGTAIDYERDFGLAALGSMVQSVNASAGTQSISVVASGDGLLRVILIDPAGLTLATADAVNGVAVLDTTVSRTGVYQVKVVNVGTNLTQTGWRQRRTGCADLRFPSTAGIGGC